MRIAVSSELCSGHGRCYDVSPDVFVSDDEGYCAQRGSELDVAPALERAARTGAAACPEGAIVIIEG